MEGNLQLSKDYLQILGKWGNSLRSLDSHVSRNLRDAGIKTRPAKTNGLWCYFLLPLILIVYSTLYTTSALYHDIAFLSIGLFFYCTLIIVFLSISCVIINEPIYGGCMASSLISAVLIYICSGKDLLYSLTIALLCIYSFSTLFKVAIINFPKTFTIGEAMIVVQSITLFIIASAVKFLEGLVNGNEEEFTFINTIIFTMLSTVGLIVAALFLLNGNQRNLNALGYTVASGAAVMLLSWHLIMGPMCLIRIIKYIIIDYTRRKLLGTWLTMVILAITVIFIQTKKSMKASTVTRKTFHVLASLVFLSGVLTDIPLMTLAAGIGFALLVFVEALRISGIEPISSALQTAFVVYGDEKDCGLFAMTPLYLYTGLACPLILAPAEAQLDLLAGVLAVGVGDTAASCVGSYFGRTRWSDSNRTVEGTAFNILSQVTVVYMLTFFDLLNSRYALTRTLIAASASALVEAKTEQVDNLILPLVSVVAFQFTWFLS